MSDVVPEFVDPPAPPTSRSPRPFRWGAWIAAVPLLPFAPKRIGVRLSVAGWPVAFVVFVACAVLALLIVGYAGSLHYDPSAGITFALANGDSAPPISDFDANHGLVGRAQNVVTSAINMIFMVTESIGDIYVVLGIVLASCALCLFLGVLALPYVAIGERIGRSLSRSTKLSLFSSVMLVVAATCAVTITHIGLLFPSQFKVMEWAPTFITMSVIAVAWWFHVIVRMGRHYAGPADGPAWQPVRPRCLGCGYILTGLPCDGDCPECGLTIGDSLGVDRKSSAWAEARRLRTQPVGWLRTCRAVFRDRDFFRTLDMNGATRKAIDFAGVTSAIPAAIVAAIALLAGIFVTERPAALFERIVCPVGLTLAGLMGTRFVFFAALSLIGLLVGYRRGVDPRAVTVAVCYSSVRLLPVIAVAIAVVVAMAMFPRLASPAAVGLPFQLSFGSLLVVIPILVLGRVLFQILGSLRDVVGVGG